MWLANVATRSWRNDPMCFYHPLTKYIYLSIQPHGLSLCQQQKIKTEYEWGMKIILLSGKIYLCSVLLGRGQKVVTRETFTSCATCSVFPQPQDSNGRQFTTFRSRSLLLMMTDVRRRELDSHLHELSRQAIWIIVNHRTARHRKPQGFPFFLFLFYNSSTFSKDPWLAIGGIF